ncbi:hypothetical protein PENTCL1PPCAC_13151, partial [Pristionchus entomophagus]
MSDPPVKKRKGSIMIDMIIDKSLKDGQTQITTHHADGFIWRLFATRVSSRHVCGWDQLKVYLGCDVDGSSELWLAKTKIQLTDQSIYCRPSTASHSFTSWRPYHNKCQIAQMNPEGIDALFVDIEFESESFVRRPILNLKSDIHDAILVLEGQKIPVDKQVLSYQSSYFNRLFYGDFKESKQDEIEL